MSPIEHPSAGTRALLLVDLQRDFLSRGGRLPAHPDQVDALILATRAITCHAKAQQWTVVRIGNHFRRTDVIGNALRRHAAIDGSDGCRWDERLRSVDHDVYIPKRKPNAFTNPELDQILRSRGVTRIYVAGVMAHACVSATANAATTLGYSVTVVEDAVADRTHRLRRRALEDLKRRGIEVRSAIELLDAVTSSEQKQEPKSPPRR